MFTTPPRIGIITIGDELLSGHTANTNTQTISQLLSQASFLTLWQKTIGDDLPTLDKTLKESLSTLDLLLITGGLGPTHDDKTREALSNLTNQPLTLNASWLQILKNRYPHLPAALENQAMILKTAKILPNPLGTAPGQRIDFQSKTIILLPGVPKEMKHLMQEEVIPWLKQTYPMQAVRIKYDLFFCNLSEGQIEKKMRVYANLNPQLSIGIYADHNIIRIHLSAERQDKDALDTLKKHLMADFKENFFSENHISLEKKILNLAKEQRRPFFILDAYTGGLLTERLSRYEQSTESLLGTMIVTTHTTDLIMPLKQNLFDKQSPLWLINIEKSSHNELMIEITFDDHSTCRTTLPAFKNLDSKLEVTRTRATYKILAYLFYAFKHPSLLPFFK